MIVNVHIWAEFGQIYCIYLFEISGTDGKPVREQDAGGGHNSGE